MDKENKPKWYHSNWSLIIAFLCVGPFMLPLVWSRPDFSTEKKITITVIAGVLTFVLTMVVAKALNQIFNYYQLMDIPE